MQVEIERLVGGFERGRLSRRQLVVGLTGLLASVAGARPLRAAQDRPGATFKATEINHVALSVTDVARSRAFYERHLGLAVTSASESSCFLRCGKDFLALFKAPKSPGLDHFCFTVEGYEPADAVNRLQAAGLSPRRQADRVYFDDPDGLELQASAPNRFEP
jgi:catechol-2,3-dioxygenase